MSFIKHGDGKILNTWEFVKTSDKEILTEEEKEALKKVKKSDKDESGSNNV